MCEDVLGENLSFRCFLLRAPLVSPVGAIYIRHVPRVRTGTDFSPPSNLPDTRVYKGPFFAT